MRKHNALNIIIVLLAPVVLYLFFLLLRPESFGQLNTLYIVVTQSFITCMVAWGMSPIVQIDQFDLSLGAEMILDSILATMFCQSLGVPGIFIGCLLGAAICGFVKGTMYRLMHIPIMILTVALVYLLGAIGGIITNSKAVTIPSNMTLFGRAPGNVIVFLVTGAIVYYFMNKSTYGANLKAMAGSAEIARANGINVEMTVFKSLLFSSLLAGVAAVVQLSHGSGVTPSVGLDSIQNIMEPMMSVFIGLVMSRYVNIVFSTFVGSLLMTVISNGITAMNWPSSLYNVVIGCVLLIIMAYINIATVVTKRRTERSKAQENVEAYKRAEAA